MNCDFQIDGEQQRLDIRGEISESSNEILFRKHQDTLAHTPWSDMGYTIIDLFSAEEFRKLKNSVRAALSSIILELSDGVDREFDLQKYHRFVNDDLHQQVISRTRSLSYRSLEIDVGGICKKVSAALCKKVTARNDDSRGNVLILRISRPNSLDVNPPHRDGYQDVWKRTINLWVPISGCEKKSSLPVIPGSHLWPESDLIRTKSSSAYIGANRYQVPAILQSRVGLNFIRPNPSYGCALLFTPFLVHGSAINQLDDTTRISLELRLPFAD